MPPRLAMCAIAGLGATAMAAALLHLYRYYRWVTYGEPMP